MQSWQTRPSSIVLIFTLALAACAGGSSRTGLSTGDGGTTGTLANPDISGTAPASTSPCGDLNCINGTVAAPAPVSFGSNPVTPQLANPGGPNFANPQAAIFPLLFTGYQWSGGGLAPIAPGAGATLTLSLGVPHGAVEGLNAVSWQISVPSAGVISSGFETAGLLGNLDSPLQALDYVAFGSWQWGYPGPAADLGSFVFGYETPPASMPVSGTAAFSGVWEGQVFTPKPGQPIQAGDVGGNASFSVDFLSGKITGALTAATSGGSYGIDLQPWNDVSVSAAIAAASNRFAGTTAVSSSPANSAGLKASATGTISGAFYGPAAQQLGAVWTLGDGTSSAIGTVIAHH